MDTAQLTKAHAATARTLSFGDRLFKKASMTVEGVYLLNSLATASYKRTALVSRTLTGYTELGSRVR